MPLKTFRGSAVGPLLAEAQAELGDDAVVIRTEKVKDGIELIAADPETAAAVGRLMRRSAAPAGETASNGQRQLDRPRPASPEILAVVGPTGAGKTTAVAKLAAHPRVFEGRRVGLLALDTFRAGAIEQLAVHASLLGAPIEPVYEASDLERAMKRLAACDVILVDCPGRVRAPSATPMPRSACCR